LEAVKEMQLLTFEASDLEKVFVSPSTPAFAIKHAYWLQPFNRMKY
jgi:hypothetical protein